MPLQTKLKVKPNFTFTLKIPIKFMHSFVLLYSPYHAITDQFALSLH